ncbi:hypothetical protein G7043_33900 [Lentzea sp. NEAU-D13]|uniref:Uncharacterized protein n=1 Tax=Lentzea alba TaxID=2714351 RepID=A0A7C9RWP0_9PSEU|nr:hypothetical protein [Lentzea alba]NGY63926.1 hypothetical protein [Lentzea alba]
MHVQQRQRARTLVSPAFFERLVARVRADHGFARSLAERVVDQALAFLKACADNRGVPLSPSWHVDVGWHAFLLYTREYAEFCHQVAGRFIHHVPTDGPSSPPKVDMVDTVAAIIASGYDVDVELWEGPGRCDTDKCHGCASGCHDDPPPIPPYRGAA